MRCAETGASVFSGDRSQEPQGTVEVSHAQVASVPKKKKKKKKKKPRGDNG